MDLDLLFTFFVLSIPLGITGAFPDEIASLITSIGFVFLSVLAVAATSSMSLWWILVLSVIIVLGFLPTEKFLQYRRDAKSKVE